MTADDGYGGQDRQDKGGLTRARAHGTGMNREGNGASQRME
jgi:hypothetical protein